MIHLLTISSLLQSEADTSDKLQVSLKQTIRSESRPLDPSHVTAPRGPKLYPNIMDIFEGPISFGQIPARSKLDANLAAASTVGGFVSGLQNRSMSGFAAATVSLSFTHVLFLSLSLSLSCRILSRSLPRVRILSLSASPQSSLPRRRRRLCGSGSGK